MKIKYFFGLIIIIFVFFILVNLSYAGDIQYPARELGNCESETNCKIYCDKPENLSVCLDFAEKNNLMSGQEIQQAKKFLAIGGKGPGGCKGKEECEEFCNDISRIDECVSFAEKNDLMPAKDLEEAKKVQSAIARGVKPPACGNKKACDVYCEELNHMEECVLFGIEAGFIQGKEADDAQKMLQAVKRGVKPPPCKGKNACDEYCSNPDNMELCMNFAMEAGFMSEQEKVDSQKMIQAIKKGVKPPSCRGKEECDVYCRQDNHFQECMDFSVAAGFMNEKEAEMARKTGGKGPGGCRGKEECEEFCNNPDNQEICFNFAKENGMMREEDIKRIEEGRKQIEEGRQNFRPGPGQENPGGQIMPQQAGPGGCRGKEECEEFCKSSPEECQKFIPERQNNFQVLPPNPCQGENCQYGPNRNFILPNDSDKKYEDIYKDIRQEEYKQIESEIINQMKNQYQPNQLNQPSQPQNFDDQPPISPPQTPPPPSGFKANSFLGALMYAIFNFFIK